MTVIENSTTRHGVTVTEMATGGLTLTHDASTNDVINGLSVLPSVASPMLAYRGLADDQGGNSWTLSFSSNEGAVEELVCVTEADFIGNCEVRTEVLGTS